MAEAEDKDLDGFFEDSDAIDAVAEEVTASEVKESVEESMSTSVEPVHRQELADVNTGIDFSSLNSLPGVVVGDTGIEVSRFPVERFKFSKDHKALISILSSKVIVAKTHYDSEDGGLGSFLCFGGACCDTDLARVRYVYPVLKYDTNAKGKPISKDFQLGSICLGQDQYDTITGLQDLKGDVTQFDLLVSCSDEQYQKITIQEAGNARWKQIPGAQEKISKFWAENGKYILKPIAKKITPEQYAKAKSGEVTTGDEVDFDDVFNS